VVINVSDAEVEAGVGFWDDVYVFDRCYRFLDLISLSPPKWDGGASGVIVVGTTALQQLTGIEPDIVVDSLGLDPYGGTVSDCGSVLRYEMSDIEPGQAVARDPVTDTLSSVAPVARNGSGASQPFSCGPMSEAGADGGKLDASADASATSPPPCPSIQPPPPPPNNEAGPTPSETEAGAGGSGASFTSGGAAGSLPSGGSPASGGSAVSGGSAASGTSATPDGSAQASNLNGVPGEAGDPGGCGCTVPGRKRGGGYGLAAALVGLVVVTARRRVRLEPLRRFP
jgi:MYXO-CTERM domain-containing protein